MRHRRIRSLARALGVVVLSCIGMAASSALGGETPAPVIQPYPPVEAPEPRISESSELPSKSRAVVAEPTPAATLDRPIALREERKGVDAQVQPTGLFSGRGSDTVSFSPAGAYSTAQPLPSGPSSSGALPMPAPLVASPPPPDVPYSWQQPPTSAQTTQNGSAPLVAPIPSISGGTGSIIDSGPPAGGIAAPGIVDAPGVATGPLGAPLVDGCCDGCSTPGCCGATCCDGCGWGDGCCGCRGCCFGNRWYGSAEYLLWFIRGQNVPPLLTSGSVADAVPGALGQPGTNILVGNSIVSNNPYSGLRLRGGYWFDDCHKWGIDVGGFFLGSGANTTSISSMGTPFLARPFVNALTGAQDIEAVAAPNGLTGTFSTVNTFFLYGAEANLRRNLFCGCNWYIDGFVGWRLLGLNESLSMNENLAVVSSSNPNLPAGSTFLVHDRFGTSNLFNGAQIGSIGEYRFGRWFVNVRGSVALGGTQQFVNISGSTTSAAPGIPATTLPGGLLAQSSNMGSYTRSMVSMVDEIGINLGYQFTPHIGAFIGYNFLYWTSVVRPAEQIDTVVNPNLIPPAVGGGPSRPQFSFNGSDFWVQGINFGLRILW
ncbi:MAG TPA: BBP7 family outer membrane beta-barrel protein [Gemmataceae bacterium]|nr:BBP7 family outer membrane beta-barrel protein [Gemmataceae bacterium]